jgi:hypothetical protein
LKMIEPGTRITGASAMHFISGRITAVVIGLTAVFAMSTARAQRLAVDEIHSPYVEDDQVVVGRGAYAAVPPPGVVHGTAGYDEALPPFEVVRIVRAIGYEPLGTPVRRRWVYTISAINTDGYDGRVVLDAYTGRVMRFIPAEVSNDVVVGDYGAPGLPSGPPPDQRIPDPRMKVHASLRPPALVPHVATREKSPAPVKPGTSTVGVAPPAQQQAPAPTKSVDLKATETKPAEAKLTEGKPTEAKPAFQPQPTQDMPPVQSLD